MVKVKDTQYWIERYKRLYVKYVSLEAKYYRLKARIAKGEPPLDRKKYIEKKKYYNLKAKFKRCRAQLLKTRLQKAGIL